MCTINSICPHCSYTTQFPVSDEGRQIICRGCSASVTVTHPKEIVNLVRKDRTGCYHIWDALNDDSECNIFSSRGGKMEDWERTSEGLLKGANGKYLVRCSHCSR